jgi:hypothetical protein
MFSPFLYVNATNVYNKGKNDGSSVSNVSLIGTAFSFIYDKTN